VALIEEFFRMKPLNADLHCHSTVSDGLLAPADVVRRAKDNGVELLALTDHDELGGLAEARATADESGCALSTGSRYRFPGATTRPCIWSASVSIRPMPSWRGPASGQERTRLARRAHGGRTGQGRHPRRLRGRAAPCRQSGAGDRSHFARYIVEQGHAKDVKSVFDHWLAKGKPGYVDHAWATLEDALRWIHGAGGIAVIAHPGRYRLSKAERLAVRRLQGPRRARHRSPLRFPQG
jgi:predicted metal-dependent phosphoesterase TrpH